MVVVEHARSTKSGNIVERVGTYDPKSKVKNLATDRIKYWISVGAQATGTVHNMLVTAGIVKGKKVNVLPQKSPPKKDLPAQAGGEEAAAEAPKAEATPAETPAAATA